MLEAQSCFFANKTHCLLLLLLLFVCLFFAVLVAIAIKPYTILFFPWVNYKYI